MAKCHVLLLLACVIFTTTRQAIADDGMVRSENIYQSETDAALTSESCHEHDACQDAWAEVNRLQDDGCLDDVKIYVERCKIPEMQQRIRDLQSRCEESKPKQFMSVNSRLCEDKHKKRQARTKRMVYADDARTWPGGKVPFLNNSPNYQRAMKTMERFTCIRFYPWSQNGTKTTNDELGLSHTSYVVFVYEGGCWARQGRKSGGAQKISCCGGIVCLHELGHALGAYHEQQNPLGAGRIRLDPQYVHPGEVFNFRPVEMSELETGRVYSSGYDMTSLLGYPQGQFGNGKGLPIDYLFSDLQGGDSWYYLLQEISHTHKCAEDYCSDFKMQCVNDGYLTLVDGVCACRCPVGLDPSTGCSTPLKDNIAEKWPLGTYAIPKPKDGCPNPLFKSGAVVHTGATPGACADNSGGCSYWFRLYGCLENPGFMNDKCPVTCNVCHLFGNHVSADYALAGNVTNDRVEEDFCVKEDTTTDDPTIKWPPGAYCIYRKGGACPEGMDSGSVTFTDEQKSTASNSVSGATVDGQFDSSSTKFEFCCSQYGFTIDEIVLPSTEPFVLLKGAHAGTCQHVRGMHAYDGYTVVRNKGGKPTTSGEVPLTKFDEDKDEYQIPYCYYKPTNKNCGGIIDLTSANPSATFEAKAGEDFMCNWVIRGPPNSRVLLKFDEFNVTMDKEGKCTIDKVNLRFDRIGQPGQVFCGDNFQKAISSVEHTIAVTFDTLNPGLSHQPNAGNSWFKARVSIINDDNLCYTEANKGHGYAGPMNRTRGMKPCIPWASVAHCPHNPFTVNDLMHSLTDNNCRNPDLSDGFRPWCYIEAEHCYRDYCDVCMYENLFDKYKDCEALAKLGYCENDPNVLENCAGTCKKNIPTFPKPQLANGVTCSPPAPISDGDVVGSKKSSYSVGDVVTYKCNDPSQPTMQDRTCLSTGEWTSLNYVCTDCHPGWFLHDGNCYQMNHPLLKQPDAVAACRSQGSQLVTAKNMADVEFLSSLNFWDGTWLDAYDNVTEGEWRWGDGTLMTWTNWASGQPDNYGNEDCVWMQSNGLFEDRWCTRDTYHYVCVKPPYAVSKCDDVTDDCANFYANNATVCTTQAEFMKSNCKKTCGMCNPATCTIEVPTGNAQMSPNSLSGVSGFNQGQWVEYECKSGFRPVSGDAVRGCLADGKMSGKPLECEVKGAVTSDEKMEFVDPFELPRDRKIHTGGIPGLIIPQDGNIVRWEFHSTRVGDAAFQVWRNTTGAQDKLEFVGQNVLTTPDDWSTIYYVPAAEQISVKKGDYIAVWRAGQEAGIGYTRCDENSVPGSWENNKQSKSTYDDSSAFSPSSSYDFETQTRNPCRIYRFRAVVQ